MRVLILTFAIVAGAVAIPAVHGHGTTAGAPAISAVAVLDAQGGQSTTPPQTSQQTQQQQPPQINVEVHRGGRAWYASPVWLAIGGLAVVVVLLLIVMAARGGGSGGTTVVRG